MYTAVVLDDTSVNILKNIAIAFFDLENKGFVFETQQGNPLPHHMTVNMGEMDSSINDPSLLSKEVKMRISTMSFDEELGACAAKVDTAFHKESKSTTPVLSNNEHPHVTIAIKPGSKPFWSNKLFDGRKCLCYDFDYVELTGVLQVCD